MLVSALPWKLRQQGAERSCCSPWRSDRAVCPGRREQLILTKVQAGQSGGEGGRRAGPWGSRTSMAGEGWEDARGLGKGTGLKGVCLNRPGPA